MRQLRCQCGGAIGRPIPSHCPHCGAKITRVTRKADWLGPMIIVLLFAAVAAFLFYLARQ